MGILLDIAEEVYKLQKKESQTIDHKIITSIKDAGGKK